MRRVLLGFVAGAILGAVLMFVIIHLRGEHCEIVIDRDPVELINQHGWTLRSLHVWQNGSSVWYLCRPA